jgi:hypothetical protein
LVGFSKREAKFAGGNLQSVIHTRATEPCLTR